MRQRILHFEDSLNAKIALNIDRMAVVSSASSDVVGAVRNVACCPMGRPEDNSNL